MREDHLVIPDALLEAMRIMRGEAMPAMAGQVKYATVCPISEERTRLRREALNNLRPGDLLEGEGVFLGRYSPVDRQGRPLNRTFNVFAAPEDACDVGGGPAMLQYKQMVAAVAELKEWHGHDGLYCKSDVDLYKCLDDGTYAGQWVIPPKELLDGRNVEGGIVQLDNMFKNKNIGAFKDSFMQVAIDPLYSPDWYWSCTTFLKRDSVWDVRIRDREGGWAQVESHYHSCRPVRFVEVTL